MASYSLQWHTAGSKLRAGQGGPDDEYSQPAIQSGLTFAADIAGKFLEVHLTQTGADLVFDGATVHSIASAPADSQYRFGCATSGTGGGFTDLAYYDTARRRCTVASDCCVGCAAGRYLAATGSDEVRPA
jgi:hypothetical protein